MLYRFEDESIEIHDLCDTYSIWGSMWVMARVNHIGGANVGLAMFTLFFVVLAPVIRSICCLCLWFIPMRASQKTFVTLMPCWPGLWMCKVKRVWRLERHVAMSLDDEQF